MTLPNLPAQGATAWYSWAQGVHALVKEVDDGDFAPVTHSHTIADMPGNLLGFIPQNADGTFPARPSARTDIRYAFVKTVAGSADPAKVTPPSTSGAYVGDIIIRAVA